MFRVALALCAGSTLAGCATFANDSAPALQPGYVYVAGRIANGPAIWLCPATPGKGECTQVDITAEEEE